MPRPVARCSLLGSKSLAGQAQHELPTLDCMMYRPGKLAQGVISQIAYNVCGYDVLTGYTIKAVLKVVMQLA